MRFLITCALLIFFQSFVVCTKEDGAITIAQTTITKSKSDQLTILISKKLNTQSVVESFFNISDKISQDLSSHFAKAINCASRKDLIFKIPIFSIEYFKEKSNHSYRFILGCLYPKHAFW